MTITIRDGDGAVLHTVEAESLLRAVELVVSRGLSLEHADLAGADLVGAVMPRANLNDARLGGANLAGCDLSGATLSGAHLYEANLSGAYLSGAYMGGAFMAKARLAYADLRRAWLGGATATECDFQHADLEAALLAEPFSTRLNPTGPDETGRNPVETVDFPGLEALSSDRAEAVTTVEEPREGDPRWTIDGSQSARSPSTSGSARTACTHGSRRRDCQDTASDASGSSSGPRSTSGSTKERPLTRSETTSEVTESMARKAPTTTRERTERPEDDVVCVDLFCGAGGLTHGLISAGVKVRVGVDFEEACRHPYEANHEGIAFHQADVAELEASTVAEWFGDAKVRVLAGCAPCQPFSTYALRYQKDEKVEDDQRWSLLNHFGRLVRELLPDIVTMENVPTVTRHSVFMNFKNTLESLGYQVWVDVIDCAEYGLPQRRNRTVLLASLHGDIKLREPVASEARTVEDVIKEMPVLRHGGTDKSDRLHAASRLSDLNYERIQHSKPGGTWRDWPKHLVAKCHTKSTGRKYPAVYGRMKYDEPAPTLTTQFYGFGNGRFGHPTQARGLSLREGALLQGFPKDYSFIPEDQPIQFKALGRMIGNAVPVDLGRVIGQSIIEHVKQSFGVRGNQQHVGQASPSTNHRGGRNGRERTGRSVHA